MKLDEKQEEFNIGLNSASAIISSVMRTIYNDAMRVAINEFNKRTAPILESLTPDEKQIAETALEKIARQIKCIFRTLVKQLFSQIKSFVAQVASRVVNVTQCYINNIVLPIMNNVGNLVNGAFDAARSSINGLSEGLLGLTEVAEGVLQAIDGVFSMNLLGSFCKEDNENNKSIVDEWCVGSGVKPKFQLGSDLINKANLLLDL